MHFRDTFSHFAKWSMKMPNSLMLKESSVMKMSLHMRNSGNLMNNCTTMSHCKLLYIFAAISFHFLIDDFVVQVR
ncbi:hypothetical protein ACE6H2_023201 [Prunus campanulata]